MGHLGGHVLLYWDASGCAAGLFKAIAGEHEGSDHRGSAAAPLFGMLLARQRRSQHVPAPPLLDLSHRVVSSHTPAHNGDYWNCTSTALSSSAARVTAWLNTEVAVARLASAGTISVVASFSSAVAHCTVMVIGA
jgi:hypothetical protein